jgi:uncharacterized protein (TIGR02599 family)
MSPHSKHEGKKAAGHLAFTLVELLVAMAVLGLVVVLSATMIGHIQKVWEHTTARTEQFQKARQALQTISGRLSQATLNPYWRVETNSSGTPVRYARQSDLRFLSVRAASLTTIAAPASGSAVFFQAPTGFSSQNAAQLDNALNTWGYFIEYGSDAPWYRPPFLSSTGVAPKNRFRLIEFTDPSDLLKVFTFTSGNATYKGWEWFSTPLATQANRRVLADNIVALVVLPRLPAVEDPSRSALSPGYLYDSTQSNADKTLNPRHQLSPIVDLAVVALDERSVRRIEWGSTAPDFGAGSLFLDPANLDADLNTLRDNLAARGLNAAVFRISVPIAAARWSTEQSN